MSVLAPVIGPRLLLAPRLMRAEAFGSEVSPTTLTEEVYEKRCSDEQGPELSLVWSRAQ
jgi:hypothetical protein